MPKIPPYTDKFKREAVKLLRTGAVVWVGDSDSLSPATFLAAPFVVVMSKLSGLYDRDELVICRSTLDETPRLFELATLCTLLFWLRLIATTPGSS